MIHQGALNAEPHLYDLKSKYASDLIGSDVFFSTAVTVNVCGLFKT